MSIMELTDKEINKLHGKVKHVQLKGAKHFNGKKHLSSYISSVAVLGRIGKINGIKIERPILFPKNTVKTNLQTISKPIKSGEINDIITALTDLSITLNDNPNSIEHIKKLIRSIDRFRDDFYYFLVHLKNLKSNR